MSGELDFGPRQLNIVEKPSRSCNGATGWTTEKLEFDYRQGKEICLLHSDQSGSELHPAAYPMITGGSYTGRRAAAWGCIWSLAFFLAQRLRIRDSKPLPTCPCGMVLN